MSRNITLTEALRHSFVILDTNVLIDECHGSPVMLNEIPFPQRATSLVAFWEFLRGSPERKLSSKDTLARERWLSRAGIRCLPFHSHVSKTLRSMVFDDRLPDLADSLIAAECLSRNCPLVTRNLEHFKHFDGLMLVTLKTS